ncbi:hypothetical protein BDV29DRAFT_158284 [Aspergillus leporis]|uniref:Ankyrin repeat-containing domain protein n=1 Tax=Aspergillus leporis TaxID=41062 RepID=A0A5N5WZL6_9EURO|nr:hypothetical protein BDV29DRAFT_158284 [Aspergillus leporis]
MLQALQWVAIQGYIGIVYWLLWAGANANERRAYFRGGAALESAAEHGRVDMLQLLLEAGVLIQDPGRRKNIRPVSLAERNGHLAASRLLKSHDGWTKEGAILARREFTTLGGVRTLKMTLLVEPIRWAWKALGAPRRRHFHSP